MSRRLEAEMSSQAARMVPEPWGEIPYFFAEHWGAFATAIAVCPPIPGSLHADFERRLELDGSYFVYRQLSPVEACDLTGWLDLLLPTVWGPKADVARIALMIRVSSETICSAKGATRMELARRFPCPILFHFEPEDDWQGWAQKHRHLLGSVVEIYPAQKGLEELAVA